jgi:acyl-CoA oxidase
VCAQVNAFIVRKGAPGLRTSKIENKTALRVVQNADILLDGVEVPEADRLTGVESFKDTNKVRGGRRTLVATERPCSYAQGARPH